MANCSSVRKIVYPDPDDVENYVLGAPESPNRANRTLVAAETVYAKGDYAGAVALAESAVYTGLRIALPETVISRYYNSRSSLRCGDQSGACYKNSKGSSRATGNDA